jgi:hypothetical protein
MAGGARTVMTRLALALPTSFDAPSETVNEPAAFGVPDNTPPENDAHAGRLVALSVRGAEPLAVSVYEKAAPTTASAESAEVMAGGARTVMTSVFVSLPEPFVAVTSTEKLPALVGVPLMTAPARRGAQVEHPFTRADTGDLRYFPL